MKKNDQAHDSKVSPFRDIPQQGESVPLKQDSPHKGEHRQHKESIDSVQNMLNDLIKQDENYEQIMIRPQNNKQEGSSQIVNKTEKNPFSNTLSTTIPIKNEINIEEQDKFQGKMLSQPSGFKDEIEDEDEKENNSNEKMKVNKFEGIEQILNINANINNPEDNLMDGSNKNKIKTQNQHRQVIPMKNLNEDSLNQQQQQQQSLQTNNLPNSSNRNQNHLRRNPSINLNKDINASQEISNNQNASKKCNSEHNNNTNNNNQSIQQSVPNQIENISNNNINNIASGNNNVNGNNIENNRNPNNEQAIIQIPVVQEDEMEITDNEKSHMICILTTFIIAIFFSLFFHLSIISITLKGMTLISRQSSCNEAKYAPSMIELTLLFAFSLAVFLLDTILLFFLKQREYNKLVNSQYDDMQLQIYELQSLSLLLKALWKRKFLLTFSQMIFKIAQFSVTIISLSSISSQKNDSEVLCQNYKESLKLQDVASTLLLINISFYLFILFLIMLVYIIRACVTCQRRKVVLKSKIDNCTIFPYKNIEQLGKCESSCIICYNDYLEGEQLALLPCRAGHIFHKDCVGYWLDINRCCPTCKFQF